MTVIAFPSSSTPGRNINEGRGRLINTYYEVQADGAVWRRSAGLRPTYKNGYGPPRGFFVRNNILHAVVGERVVSIAADGTVTTLVGYVPGTQPITAATNNNGDGRQTVIVADLAAYTVTDTNVAEFMDPDLPTPNSVSFLDGFLLYTIADGRMFASNFNELEVDALSFAIAEAKSDGLLRGLVKDGMFYACGPASIEVWGNQGNQQFPLVRAEVIQTGLLAANCIAGDEDGWDSPLLFIASDLTVRQLDGYTPTIVSTPDVAYSLEKYINNNGSVSRLRTYVYTIGINAFFVIKAPTFCWEYNVRTQKWTERKSDERDTWRGQETIFHNNRWLVGDDATDDFYTVTSDYFYENDKPLIATIESAAAKEFPYRSKIPAGYIDITLGSGRSTGIVPIQTDPNCMISWSMDGGATWANPLLRSIGQQGRYVGPIRVGPLGRASHHGIRFRVSVSDPVDFSFLGGEFAAEQLRP